MVCGTSSVNISHCWGTLFVIRYLSWFPSEYHIRIIFDHSHFQNISSKNKNCCFKNFLCFGVKHVPQSAVIAMPKYTRFFVAWGSPKHDIQIKKATLIFCKSKHVLIMSPDVLVVKEIQAKVFVSSAFWDSWPQKEFLLSKKPIYIFTSCSSNTRHE